MQRGFPLADYIKNRKVNCLFRLAYGELFWNYRSVFKLSAPCRSPGAPLRPRYATRTRQGAEKFEHRSTISLKISSHQPKTNFASILNLSANGNPLVLIISSKLFGSYGQKLFWSKGMQNAKLNTKNSTRGSLLQPGIVCPFQINSRCWKNYMKPKRFNQLSLNGLSLDRLI